ncbi:MAG: BLUF domain-containing protein [Phenylobacterium sp.]
MSGTVELTGEVLRAARAMARLEQVDLAAAAGVSVETVKRLERLRGPVNANVRTLEALTTALRGHDIAIRSYADGSVGLFLLRGESQAGSRIPLPPRSEPAALHRLIYHSTSLIAPERAEHELADILGKAIPRNAADSVSGALVFANGRFLQALEGARSLVANLYASIERDPRHRDLTVIENRQVAVRRFPNWVMCARAASEAEIRRTDPSQADGFRPERLSPPAALGVLAWVSELELAALA